MDTIKKELMPDFKILAAVFLKVRALWDVLLSNWINNSLLFTTDTV
jgi:hypothetical protein